MFQHQSPDEIYRPAIAKAKDPSVVPFDLHTLQSQQVESFLVPLESIQVEVHWDPLVEIRHLKNSVQRRQLNFFGAHAHQEVGTHEHDG
jgi:hypothetical protein